MTRLTDFKKDIPSLSDSLSQSGYPESPSLFPAPITADSTTPKEEAETPRLRHQIIRWYNTNPDMFNQVCQKAMREVETQGRKGKLSEYTETYRQQDTSLTQHDTYPYDIPITFLEDMMFIDWPVLSEWVKTHRQKGHQPTALIASDLREVTIFDLTNALVEFSQTTTSSSLPRYAYADMIDILLG